MPPKKKGKKAKKSKEELEAERKAKEEEEARIKLENEKRLEEERKLREEQERKRFEEETQQRAAELKRLNEEYEECLPEILYREKELQSKITMKLETEEWRKYLACDPRPDANVEGDINSFVNTWNAESELEMKEVISSMGYAEEVIRNLEKIKTKCLAVNNREKANQCDDFVEKIKAIIFSKLDLATAHVLQYADEFTDASSKNEVKIMNQFNWIKVGLWINLIVKGFRNKKISFDNLGICIDIPKAIALQPLAVRVTHTPVDPWASDNIENVTTAFGGSIQIDLLTIPPPPKRVHGWLLREKSSASDKAVQILQYPMEGMLPSTIQPMKVSIRLPSNIVYPDSPRIGWWDAAAKCWKEDGITDITLERENIDCKKDVSGEANPLDPADERGEEVRPSSSISTDNATETCADGFPILHFSTIKLTSLAILQDRNINYEKSSWVLQMKESNSESFICFAMNGGMASFSVELEIRDSTCRLMKPALPQLKELRETQYSPGELLQELANCGINICPSRKDDHFDERFGKNEYLENRLNIEIAHIAPAFEISSAQLSDFPESWKPYSFSYDHAIFRVKEITWHSFFDGENDEVEEYFYVLAEVDMEVHEYVKFTLYQDCSSNEQRRKSSHVHLHKALEPISTPYANELMKNASVSFQHTICKTLRLIRPFSHTVLRQS